MTINVLSELQLRPEREDIIMSAWKPLYFACEIMQNNDVQWNTKFNDPNFYPYFVIQTPQFRIISILDHPKS